MSRLVSMNSRRVSRLTLIACAVFLMLAYTLEAFPSNRSQVSVSVRSSASALLLYLSRTREGMGAKSSSLSLLFLSAKRLGVAAIFQLLSDLLTFFWQLPQSVCGSVQGLEDVFPRRPNQVSSLMLRRGTIAVVLVLSQLDAARSRSLTLAGSIACVIEVWRVSFLSVTLASSFYPIKGQSRIARLARCCAIVVRAACWVEERVRRRVSRRKKKNQLEKEEELVKKRRKSQQKKNSQYASLALAQGTSKSKQGERQVKTKVEVGKGKGNQREEQARAKLGNSK